MPVVTLGLSFLIFRQVHMAIEVRDDVLREFGWFDYLSYQLAFWTFTSGPIQRYEPFCAEFHGLAGEPRGATAQAVLLGLNRVMFGYLKMFVIGAWWFKLARIRNLHPSFGRWPPSGVPAGLPLLHVL